MNPRTVLALGLLIVALPSEGNAASVINTFLTSTSGSRTLQISDTIQFEVIVTTDPGVDYNVAVWSLTGDADYAIASTMGIPWAPPANFVIDWEWHYTPAGGSKVQMSLDQRIFPAPTAIPPPARSSGAYGMAGQSRTGTGVPAMVGTVTLHVDTLGVYRGGAFQWPGVDGFLGSGGGGVVPFSGGEFTVVPEPTTALLLGAGLSALAWRGRVARRRS